MKIDLEKLRSVTNEEVDSIELEHGEFVQSDNKARAYQLENEDVFTIQGNKSFQFYENLLYEVEFDGYEYDEDGFGMNPKWKRTGVTCKIEDFNDKYIYKEDE